jgi:hypothetical protein
MQRVLKEDKEKRKIKEVENKELKNMREEEKEKDYEND